MICQVCDGNGLVLRASFPSGEPLPRPCTACGGSGIAHCCEGDRLKGFWPDDVRAVVERLP